MLDLIDREQGLTGKGAFDWLRSIGIESDDRPKFNGNGEPRHVVATYVYHDLNSTPLFRVLRWGPQKTFRQQKWDPTKNAFVGGEGCMKGVKPVPYRVNEWYGKIDDLLLIAEGEKDVDRLWNIGFQATCNAGGAGKWNQKFADYMVGRDVIILPDNDDAGREHARQVAASLVGEADSIRIVELPALKDKGDVSDWLDAGGSADRLRGLMEGAREADEVIAGWPEHKGPEPEAAVPAPQGAVRPYEATLLRDVQPNLKCRFVVKDLIPRAALGMLYAEPTAGKTSLIIDLLMHIASGYNYRNLRTERQPVIYCALEGKGGIENRIWAARQYLSLDNEDIPFALLKISDNFRQEETARRIAENAKALIQTYRGDNPVIAIDTYQAALGGGASDSKPEDVTPLIENIKRALIDTGCTVLLIHHTGKDKSRGARGWSGMLGAVDFEFEMERDKDSSLRTVNVSKMRDGSDQQPTLCMELETVEIGEDQYGEKVTSVAVRHLDDAKGGSRLKLSRINPTARAVLNVLWSMIKEKSKSFPLPNSGGLRCVLMDDLRSECIKPDAICKVNLEKDRVRKFKKALEELIEKNVIVIDGDMKTRVYPYRENGRENRKEAAKSTG